MTDETRRRLALALAEGRAYTTQDVPTNLWIAVFLPLGFAKKRDLRGTRMVMGVVGEHRSTGQAVNGYPVFVECQLLKARDTRAVVRYAEQFTKARNHMLRRNGQ